MEERSLPRLRSTPSIPAPLSLIRPSACAGATWLPTLARTAADSGPHGCRLWPARLVAVQALPRRGAHALPPLCRSSIRMESQVHQSRVPPELSSESIRVELQVLLGRRPMRVPASVVRGQNWRGTGAGQRVDRAACGLGRARDRARGSERGMRGPGEGGQRLLVPRRGGRRSRASVGWATSQYCCDQGGASRSVRPRASWREPS